MKAFTVFSKHALHRIQERTTLRESEIAEILDANRGLNLGRKPGFDREHWLFYSLQDDDYFVAIRDRLVGKVVTVLPLDFHSNVAWPVTDQQKAEAKALYRAPGQMTTSTAAPDGQRFRVSIGLCDSSGHVRWRSAGKYTITDKYPDPESFSKVYIERMMSCDVDRLRLDMAEVVGITIRIGKNGDPVYFDVPATVR